MVALGDHLHPVISVETLAAEDPFEGCPIRAVGNQQFVLIKLDLQRRRWVEHSDTGAAVIEQQVFKIPEKAFEEDPFNSFPAEGFQVSPTIVRRLKNDVTGVAQRLEQLQKSLEELLARDSSDESW